MPPFCNPLHYRQPLYFEDGNFNNWHYWGYFEKEENRPCPASQAIGFVAPVLKHKPHSTIEQSQPFTGMHDQSGKNIYAGDFLRDSSGRIWLIVWHPHTGSFKKELHEKKKKKFEGRLGPYTCGIADYSLNKMEVVGNIIETREYFVENNW